MAGLLPDGGVLASQASNTLPNALLKEGCDSLWHANRCAPKFDPAAANAVISEIINVVNAAGYEYDCGILNNLAIAVGVHQISGNTSFPFNNTGTPVNVPNGGNNKIGGGNFFIPNTYHREIYVALYLDTTIQLDLDGGDNTSAIEINWKINETNDFSGVNPNLTVRKSNVNDSEVYNNVWFRVVPIPPGGRTYYWEVRSSTNGAGSWELPYTDTALQVRCYGVSHATRDGLSAFNPPD